MYSDICIAETPLLNNGVSSKQESSCHADDSLYCDPLWCDPLWQPCSFGNCCSATCNRCLNFSRKTFFSLHLEHGSNVSGLLSDFLCEDCVCDADIAMHSWLFFRLRLRREHDSLPWWSWGVHSGCFQWWRASRCSLGGCTPASGNTSSLVHTSRIQTWGLPSDTSRSCPASHNTYTGGLWRRDSEENLRKRGWGERLMSSVKFVLSN